MRPRSLRSIMAIFVVIFLVALIGVRAVNYKVGHEALGREVDRRLASEAAAIVGSPKDATLDGMIDRIEAAQQDHDTADLFYMLVDRHDRKLTGKLTLTPLPPIGYSDFTETARVDGVAHGRALARRVAQGALLVVVSDNDAVDSFDALMFRVQLIGLGITALIVIGSAVGITLAIGNRMRAMQRTVDAVIGGDLHSRIPLDGSRSEFDQQAAAFNRMLDRIDALMASVKHSAKDITHELKSPLARLRSKTAALARRTQQDAIGPDVEDLVEQVDAILDLFSSLLRLWEIEGGNRRERFVDVDLGALAQDTALALQAVAEDAGQRIAMSAPPPVPVRGDVHLLRQMIVNLIENAIRHTPQGTNIIVSISVKNHHAVLVVSDDGPGIAAAQHEAVIRRFGRLEAEGKTPGQGLGLTLVDAIARLHDGGLTLEEAQPGLRAIITMPAQM